MQVVRVAFLDDAAAVSVHAIALVVGENDAGGKRPAKCPDGAGAAVGGAAACGHASAAGRATRAGRDSAAGNDAATPHGATLRGGVHADAASRSDGSARRRIATAAASDGTSTISHAARAAGAASRRSAASLARCGVSASTHRASSRWACAVAGGRTGEPDNRQGKEQGAPFHCWVLLHSERLYKADLLSGNREALAGTWRASSGLPPPNNEKARDVRGPRGLLPINRAIRRSS